MFALQSFVEYMLKIWFLFLCVLQLGRQLLYQNHSPSHKPTMVKHICNPSSQKVEAGGLEFELIVRTSFKDKFKKKNQAWIGRRHL